MPKAKTHRRETGKNKETKATVKQKLKESIRPACTQRREPLNAQRLSRNRRRHNADADVFYAYTLTLLLQGGIAQLQSVIMVVVVVVVVMVVATTVLVVVTGTSSTKR